MKRLILLRHAKAVAKNEAGDFERALSPSGRAEMGLVAAYLAEQPDRRPDLALVSSAARTRETWSIAQGKLGAVATAFEEEIYEAAPERLLEVLREADGILADGPTETLILVGHNPGLSDLAQMLTRSDASGVRADVARGMPTAGLAILDVDITAWRDLAPGRAQIVAFTGPDAIAPKQAG